MKQSSIRTIIGILLGLVVVLGAVGTYTFVALRRAFFQVQEVRSSLAQAERLIIKEQDFSGSARLLRSSATILSTASNTLGRVPYVRLIPWVGTQFKAASTLIEAAQISTEALASAVEVAGELYAPLKRHGKVPIGELPVEERVAFLQDLYEAVPKLQTSQEELARAHDLVLDIDRAGLITPLRAEVEQADRRINLVMSVLRDGIPLFQVLPSFLGFPNERSYLFVLQNSAEMRPTGGFLGTYGLLTLQAGHITSFSTDDVYNLDRHVPPGKRPPAPEPLAHYLEQPKFYLRDANWSPDFPTSAQKILQFYSEELLAQPNLLDARRSTLDASIDGVIAIMPEAVTPLLTLTGPLSVDGQTFTAENLTDLLEYQVEIGFAQKGIPRPQRKEIVSELGHALIARVLQLPVEKWIEVLHLMRTALDEKHILLYSNDPALQSSIVQNGWSGMLRSAPQDYLAVFDANLFSLKTDPYVPRSIFYTVRREPLGLIGEVEIVYSYPRSGPAWKTKGYRTWTRVYVPKGSILASASGVMAEEGSSKPGSVTLEQEFNKTVFGAFIAVEVGEIKRLRFKYRLPEAVGETVAQGRYELLVQKQAGTIGHHLTVQADFGTVPRQWDPTGLGVARQESGLTWQTSLRRDQAFKIEF